MKKTMVILGMLLLAACSSDDSSGNSAANALVKQYVFTASDGYSENVTIPYDDKKRDAAWQYSDLQVYREDPTIVRSVGGGAVYTYTITLNPQGYAGDIYITTYTNAYSRTFTYDEKGRVIKEEIREKFLNGDTGVPQTSFKLAYTIFITWDNENNITSVKNIIDDSDYYNLITFSDFSAHIKNTVKSANQGFDFFGPYGYPVLSTLNSAQFYLRQAYGGNYLPAKKATGSYYISNDQPYDQGNTIFDSTMSYQKDSKGRVVEIYEDYDSTDGWLKTRYSY